MSHVSLLERPWGERRLIGAAASTTAAATGLAASVMGADTAAAVATGAALGALVAAPAMPVGLAPGAVAAAGHQA
jgi:hypothetical protein